MTDFDKAMAALNRAAALHRVSLTRHRLNSGGYDSSGCYYGNDKPRSRLWSAQAEDGSYSDIIRASSRNDAKEQVRKTYPAATFYR